MDNAEEVLQLLEEFTKRKLKTIPPELDDYLAYVARTGDPVYQWAMVKSLFKEKLMNVISDFNETSPGMDIPPYPNVDVFDYETMKDSLLERLDSFVAAPFTVQRICELLMYPRKQYNRIDKFMRAIEKNILVVSTREPGVQRHEELENGDPPALVVNGSDTNDYTVDVEMEEPSWKEKGESNHTREPQPGSSDISVDSVEVRLYSKRDSPKKSKAITTEYESITPPEISAPKEPPNKLTQSDSDNEQKNIPTDTESVDKKCIEAENLMKTETSNESNDKVEVDEVEMAEDLKKPSDSNADADDKQEDKLEKEIEAPKKEYITEEKTVVEVAQEDVEVNESNDSPPEKSVDNSDTKIRCEMEELSESSSENSSSSEGYINSPKTEQDTVPIEEAKDTEAVVDVNEESNCSKENKIKTLVADIKETEESEIKTEFKSEAPEPKEEAPKSPLPGSIEADKYSISDVKSDLAPLPATVASAPEEASSVMEANPVDGLPNPVAKEPETQEPKEDNSDVA